MNSAVNRSIWIVLLLCVVFAAGLAVRRTVLCAQYECYGRPLPFELESALYFRYVRLLFEQGKLPAIDKMVQYPEGVAVAKTYEIGCEYLCAVFAGFFPSRIDVAERVRWISVAWFCLGIPALFLWLWWWRSSVFGAFLGALFYAVSLASVMRSTGQEISHENFALPMLIACLAAGALAERKREKQWLFAGVCALSAVFLACSLMLWDLIQFYLIVLALLAAWRAVLGDYFRDGRARFRLSVFAAVLTAAGLLNPYLRAHDFVCSPAMLLVYGVLLAMPWRGRSPSADNVFSERRAELDVHLLKSGSRWAVRLLPCEVSEGCLRYEARAARGSCRRSISVLLRLGLVLLPLMLGLFIFNGYSQNYGHFFELFCAKIMFLNHKPADPALLTFAQRILWVPALNSANFLLTKNLFPVTLPLFLLSTGIVLFGRHRPIDPEIENRKSKIQNFLFDPRRRTDPQIIELLFFACLSFAAFILFVRLHVFAAVGVAAMIGLLGSWAAQLRNVLLRLTVVFLLLSGAVAEAAHVLNNPLRWGREQPYLAERRELMDWLKANADGRPVLANFGISASVAAYAGCPIILHPKFEAPEIRKRVREYGEALFKSDEGVFRSWAEGHGAVFYVYSLGEFARVRPEAQMRYFVDALNPPSNAAARIFEFAPRRSRWFEPLWQNRKYRVFRVITRADEQTAREQARLAARQIELGKLKDAQGRAELALLYDPGNKDALATLLRVDDLRKRQR